MEVFRASPRQADLMIVAGRVSQKMAPVLRQIYDQMAEPKWVLAMGVCASSGGMFNNYAIVQGVDHVVPVDMYLPGCPPRPEMLIDAILKLHDKIRTRALGPNAPSSRPSERRDRRAVRGRRRRHDDEGPAAVTRSRRPGAAARRRARDRRVECRDMFGAAARRHVRLRRPGRRVRSPSTPRPYGGYFDEVADALGAAYPELSRRRSSASSSTAASSPCTCAREHLRRARRSRCATTTTLRFELCSSRVAASTTRRTPAASCTPSTT